MESAHKNDKEKLPWYLKPSIVIISILAIGPFAIPLVWMSPAIKREYKIILSIATIALTVLMIKAAAELYLILLNEFRDLAQALR